MCTGKDYLVISILVGISFLAFGSVDKAYATDYVLSDSASCAGLPNGGGIWDGVSTCTKTNNLSVTSANTLIINDGITLAFPSGNNLINRGSIANNGIINITDGFITNRNSGIFTNTGTIILNGTSGTQGTLRNQNGASFTNSGTIIIDGTEGNSGRLLNRNNAYFSNFGTITIDGSNNNSGQLRNLHDATITNFGTITIDGSNNNSGQLRNFSVLTNTGSISTNMGFLNTNTNSILTNSGTILITLTLDNTGGLISNNCGDITFGSFTGNPIEEESCQTSAGSYAYEDPTIGKSHNGRQMVENGICIDVKCWTVTAAFHQDFELVEMLSDSIHTITTTVFCQSGVHKCNYVAYGVSPYGTNINHSVWKIILQKDHLDNWTMSIIDPDGYLGEVTSTTQIVNDNKHLAASATIEFKKPTPGMILNVEVRDSNGGYRDFKFNDGIAITDSYAYPQIDSSYDAPLEIEPLCLYENPDKRYTCAFAKIREQTLIDAQIVYEDVINKKR